MGVYINMEMPKNCLDCRLVDVEFSFCHGVDSYDTGNHNTDKERPEWCPLVEIPPHGRLIDADAMEKTMSDTVQGNIRGYPYSDTLWDTAFRWIDNQPTIIQAGR